MRLGFFTDTFLPQRNGVVTSVLSFGSELVRRGHEVHVFCPKTRVKEINGIRVYSYPAVRFRPYPEFRIAVPQGKDRVPPLDLVHSHSPFTMGFFGIRVAKHHGLPRVASFHTLLTEYLRYAFRVGAPLMKFFTWEFCRVFYNWQHRVITPSRTLKRVLREKGIKRPIEVVPNGIDTSFYRPHPKHLARKKLGLGNERVFLSLGRLSYEKKVDVVIRAMKRVNGKLVVCGRGPHASRLKELVRRERLSRKVVFHGFVREELKPLYYSAADALVVASTSETQGVVMLEAMACGTPVIGARALAIPEIVKPRRNGLLFEPDNTDELAEMLDSFEPTEAMSTNARRTASEYSVDRMVSKLVKLYRRLIRT